MRLDQKGREIFNEVMSSREFAKELAAHGDWFIGVPDSVLKLTQANLPKFYFSPRENHAVAAAFGAQLGGAKPCVLMQNSGLGLATDALLGLSRLYGQGLVLVISNRGELAWEEDQHLDWGRVTVPMLKSLQIPVLDFQELGISAVATAFSRAYVDNEIVTILVHRGNLDE